MGEVANSGKLTPVTDNEGLKTQCSLSVDKEVKNKNNIFKPRVSETIENLFQ
jgi:hypothetical protein